MNCAICGSELERDEKWDGSYSFSCPLCGREKSTSQKEPEKDIYGFKSWAGGSTVAEAEKLAEKENENA